MGKLEELHAARTEALEDYINLMEGHRPRLLELMTRNSSQLQPETEIKDCIIIIGGFNCDRVFGLYEEQTVEIHNAIFGLTIESNILEALQGQGLRMVDRARVIITSAKDKRWMTEEARPAFNRMTESHKALRKFEKEKAP